MHIRRVSIEGWVTRAKNPPTTIQRFIKVYTGTVVDAIVLANDHYLVLQDDTVCCCKVVHYPPDTLAYQCEYTNLNYKMAEADLASRINNLVDEAFDKHVEDMFPNKPLKGL